MKKIITIAIALSILYFATAEAGPKEYILQRRAAILMPQPIFKSPYRKFSGATIEGTIEQVLDHNSKKTSQIFKQRYWRNSLYALNDASPVLFYICGEGACGSYAVGGQIARHAQKLNAHIFALEHRYYGQSQPFSDLSTKNLVYLTTDFALKDLVEFQKFAQLNFKLTGKWITVGGSYPGSLSAYARALYPHLFSGALGSSAPVMADLDFSEYDEHVALMAGPQCLSAIKNVVAEIESEITSDDSFEKVKLEFNASALRDRDDFLYLLADTGAAAIQYGMRMQFCSLLESSGRAGYASAVEMVSNTFGNLVDLSAQSAEDISLDKHSQGIGMRQWFYQSCTEYGYWQNASPNPALRARSARINAEYHSRICKRLFDLNEPARVNETNAQFYAQVLNSKTDKIYFTNGSEDPWINLSITESNGNHINPNLISHVIPAAAHCDDLGAGSSPALNEAKEKFYQLSLDWVK